MKLFPFFLSIPIALSAFLGGPCCRPELDPPSKRDHCEVKEDYVIEYEKKTICEPKCEYIPLKSRVKKVRYIPRKTKVKCVKYVPQYVVEEVMRYEPEYYYEECVNYHPKVTYEKKEEMVEVRKSTHCR